MDARQASAEAAANPHRPINPPEALGDGVFALPAYLSNGLLGLRLLSAPLQGGVSMLNGFVGQHAQARVEAAARTPFPLAADLVVDGVRLSQALYLLEPPRQAHDFATGEVTTRATFRTARLRGEIEVVTFCSRRRPTFVCQEIRLRVDAPCKVDLSAGLDPRGVDGREGDLLFDGQLYEQAKIDGGLRWWSHADVASCGLAYVTELLGDDGDVHRSVRRREQIMETVYGLEAEPGRTYRLRQMTSLVSDGEHHQPEMQAARLAAMAAQDGFETLRAENRAEWESIWTSRVRLVGAEPRWQALADAAWYYLNASVHSSALASTSIFGLATWPDYHHYYGHVMWDIETFVVPAVTFLQPHAAATMLDYRSAHLDAAHKNAALFGRRGVQFPWESGRSTGEEAAPLPGSASWHEDHVTLDVARGFAFYADVTGDERYLRDRAAPALAGVADWITSRVTRTARGFEFKQTLGIAERGQTADNAAFVNMSARVVLRDAVRLCGRAGAPVDPRWGEIADGLYLPMQDGAVVSHDGWRADEEKGATPDPLLGVFPTGCELPDDVTRATFELFLGLADQYVGSPMLSAFYGAWAAMTGDREAALRLLEEGYGKFIRDRFSQTLEYRPDKFPEQPQAGPFFANIGGFALSLLLGFTGLRPDGGPPASWARRAAVLPAGWKAIEVDRLWVRGQPMRLVARHGEAARLEPATDDGA
jgi:trehalose/maltose hydrolase-like predicted phosphorylase